MIEINKNSNSKLNDISLDNFYVIADFDNYDVQQLLIDSRLLITDYSSVAFDFAYMKKKTIYCQFDLEKYRSEQYGIGFKKGNDALKDQVQKTLDEMFEDGTVAKIAQKYDEFGVPGSLIQK